MCQVADQLADGDNPDKNFDKSQQGREPLQPRERRNDAHGTERDILRMRAKKIKAGKAMGYV